MKKFIAANSELIDTAKETLSKYDDGSVGHDFWLSRNGHGAGFFDRGNEDVWDELQDAAKKFKEVDLYLGDDGKIHA